MKDKKKITLILPVALIVLLLSIGITYAYFSANITGGEDTTTITVTGGTMNIYYNGGADIDISNILPSNKPFATKTFTVTGNNTTDLEMNYEVNIVVEQNTFSENALKYKLISTNTDNNGKVIASILDLTNIGSGAKSILLGIGGFESPTDGNKIHTYNLELYFPETNTNQNIDQDKKIKVNVEIKSSSVQSKKLYDSIISQGGGVDEIVNRGTPNFNELNGISGIYAAEDEYGASYYYRGVKSELNNNVLWAGFQWKIVRINGDDSIKMIYNGTEDQFNTNKTVNDQTYLTHVADIPWNTTNYNDAKYVGYMYGGANGAPSTMRHGLTSEAALYNETSNNVKTNLEVWYKTNIVDKGYSDVVVDNLFCNDRQLENEVGGPATGPGYGAPVNTNYASLYRLWINKTPVLKCEVENDSFTVNDVVLGNGKLTYPVGLITVDEASLAGMKFKTENTTNYLQTNSAFWTMSPYGINGSNGSVDMFVVKINGELSNNRVTGWQGIRPTVSISNNTQVTGSGSATDPFKVL